MESKSKLQCFSTFYALSSCDIQMFVMHEIKFAFK